MPVRYHSKTAAGVVRTRSRTGRTVALGAVVALLAAVTLPAGSAAASSEPATTTVGASPDAVAIDPSTHTVYVANGAGGTVSVIDESGDGHTGDVIGTVGVGFDPTAVAVDPSRHDVYVANANADEGAYHGSVSVIDESGDAGNGTVTATIAVGVLPAGIAVDPSNHHVYVTNVGSSTVSVIDESGDADNGKVTATIPVAMGPVGVAVDPSRHNVYVESTGAAAGSATMSVIDESGDADNGKVTATVPAGTLGHGVLAVDLSTHDVYVAAYRNFAFLTVIDESGDSRTGTVTGHLPVAIGSISDVVIDPTTHAIYVAFSGGSYGNAETDVYRTTSEYPDEVAGLAGGLAVDPSTHDVYVATSGRIDSASPGSLTELGWPTDLAMTVAAPTVAADGTTFTETATVTDLGPSVATGVAVNLLVPAGLTVSSAPGASVQYGTLVWTGATLEIRASATYNVTFTVGADVHTTAAIGGVTEATDPDVDPTNNAAVGLIRLG